MRDENFGRITSITSANNLGNLLRNKYNTTAFLTLPEVEVKEKVDAIRSVNNPYNHDRKDLEIKILLNCWLAKKGNKSESLQEIYNKVCENKWILPTADLQALTESDAIALIKKTVEDRQMRYTDNEKYERIKLLLDICTALKESNAPVVKEIKRIMCIKYRSNITKNTEKIWDLKPVLLSDEEVEKRIKSIIEFKGIYKYTNVYESCERITELLEARKFLQGSESSFIQDVRKIMDEKHSFWYRLWHDIAEEKMGSLKRLLPEGAATQTTQTASEKCLRALSRTVSLDFNMQSDLVSMTTGPPVKRSKIR